MKPSALLLALPVVFAAAACSSAPVENPAEDPSADSTSEALGVSTIPGGAGRIGGIGGVIDPGPVNPGPYGPVPAWPIVSRKAYCPLVDTQCSMYSTVDWHDAPTDQKNAELASYGCIPQQQWFSGYAAGWLGGIIALCSDSLALRQHFGPGAFNWMDGACDKCIPRAPAGQVWIMLEAFVGPNCQGGCRVRNEGGW